MCRHRSKGAAEISPTVHRLVLDLTDRQALAIANAIQESTNVAPEIARIHAIALAGVFRIIIGDAGARTAKGQSQATIARELRPIIASVLDELDAWFRVHHLYAAHRPRRVPTNTARASPVRRHLVREDMTTCGSVVPRVAVHKR